MTQVKNEDLFLYQKSNPVILRKQRVHMASPTKEQRFALLIAYMQAENPNYSQQKLNALLSGLTGCINDVSLVKNLLESKFMFNNVRVLTSTSGHHADLLPTYHNIKSAFDTICAKINSGDIFFFVFAGHGALLPRVPGSPPGRNKDPSLLTADHAIDKSRPAIRGWELNKWLEELHKKQVRVVACLDSCHLGGSWRTGCRVRTPLKWDQYVGAFEPEDIYDEELYGPVSRNAELQTSWVDNPDGFTLMAACDTDQLAEEFVQSDGKSLQKFYGRDKLAFLESYDAFVAAPIVSTAENDVITIPMGHHHAVYPGSDFRLGSPWHDVVVQVTEVKIWNSRAKLPLNLLTPGIDPHPHVVPSKWGLGEETFQVFVDKRLGRDFRKALNKSLQMLLAGTVEVKSTDKTSVVNHNGYGVLFYPGLRNKIDIFGPSEVTGYKERSQESK
ncbi:caspase domain-containing protein [Podospora fimiseda]|uniref:Caspase domain-containing protein n=1 Tax=Podospora fimiseda TaxID=252190 RepID=A0AAN7H5A8_9PEZI|nr:caspase domain-containing protein [Podospora fimiseda]